MILTLVPPSPKGTPNEPPDGPFLASSQARKALLLSKLTPPVWTEKANSNLDWSAMKINSQSFEDVHFGKNTLYKIHFGKYTL